MKRTDLTYSSENVSCGQLKRKVITATMLARTCSGLKATTHQATFRQFVTVVSNQLPANLQAISKQLVDNTCTLTLYPNKMVDKSLLLALLYLYDTKEKE